MHDETVIRSRIVELGKKLDSELRADDPLVLSIIGGSLMMLADLLRVVATPLRFELIHVDYGAPARDQALQIHFPVPVDVAGQSLLLLKDVVSTGIIETYLANELRERGARAVRFAALVDVPSERKTELAVDYPLFTEERQGAFVGYGLKHDGRHGNLPYLGRVQENR
ncbi:MAG TPA: phosphoribosyltransferase family protein [Kofleriaceae bacterium]